MAASQRLLPRVTWPQLILIAHSESASQGVPLASASSTHVGMMGLAAHFFAQSGATRIWHSSLKKMQASSQTVFPTSFRGAVLWSEVGDESCFGTGSSTRFGGDVVGGGLVDAAAVGDWSAR
jgi:hypothetical protein